MPKFTEDKLEQAIIALLGEQGFPHTPGASVSRSPNDVLIRDDLRSFLANRYAKDGINEHEISTIINRLDALSASDLYASNKTIHKWVADGFLLKREDHTKKDLYIQLLDYAGLPEQREPRPGEVDTLIADDAGATTPAAMSTAWSTS